MERVLVTGGTGFIGRHVVRALAARGMAVEALVRPQSSLSVFDGLRVQTVVGDVLDPTTYGDAVQRADQVIHMASLLKMPWSPRFRSVHVDGTEGVASACAQAAGRPSLLVVSSLAAFGPNQASEAPDETNEPAPVSLYGRAKRDAELRAISYSNEIPVTIVRPPAVYGPWDRTLLKIFRTVRRGVHIVPGNRDSRMSMVHVEDLADAIVEASRRGERVGGTDQPPDRGVYFLSGEPHPTYGSLGALVAGAMEVPPPKILEVPRFAARWAATAIEGLARLSGRASVLNRDKILEAHSGHWTCRSDKAARQLNWRPDRGLEARLRETCAWYRSHGWLG